MTDKRPRNRARCKICDEVIESKHVHDFVMCKGEHFFIDGGREYFRYGGKNEEALLARSKAINNVPYVV